MEDHEIIDLFFERSEQAIAELGNKYGRVVKKVSLNILNSPQDAEECVSDAYLGVWESVPPQRPDPLAAYLCRIVRNLSIKKYRANTAVKRNSFYDAALDELEDCIPSRDTVETQYDAKELGEIIESFLGTLHAGDRVLFMRRYWFSDSMSDIAAAFRITEHNAAVRLSRTRAKLRNYLRKEGVFL